MQTLGKVAVILGVFGFLTYIYIVHVVGDIEIQHVLKAVTTPSMMVTLNGSDVSSSLNYTFRSLKLFNESETDTFSQVIRFKVTDDGKQCKGRRFLVYTCKSVCGGWGDRLKGITTLFLLAQLTNRTLLIDMPKPCELHTLVIPNLYDWNKCLAEMKTVPSNETVHSSLMAGISLKKMDEMLHGELGTHRVISVQTNVQEVRRIRKHKLCYDAMPWMRNLTDAEVLGSIIGILFKPTQKLSGALTKFKTETVRGRRLVCSHIRYGKNPTIPNDNSLRQGAPNVSRILKFIKNYDNFEDVAIFVATDSVEVRNQSRYLFSNFVSAERRIVHVDRTKGGTNELCDGFLAVLLDQLVLSRCDVLVLTRSNFGAMAAYMRGKSENLFLNVKTESNIINVTVTDIQNIFRFV